MKLAVLLVGMPLLFAQDGAVVEGTTYNKLTQAALPGVTIALESPSQPFKPLYSVKSDAAGAFRIVGVKDGVYVASFDAPPGFVAPRRWVDPICQPFQVAVGSSPTELRVPLLPLGKLRGRVLDPDGHPVARVRVELFQGGGGSIETTDSEGRFLCENLMPGLYRLRARPVLEGTPLGRKPESVSALPAKPPEGERWIWAPTYYPDSIEISGSTPIMVQDGSEGEGYDIRLHSAPVYRLRGVVWDDAGKPAGGVRLSLSSEIGWGTREADASSGEDGTFEFRSVRAGDWRVSAEAIHGETTWKGFTDLFMPRHDVDDAELRIAPPFTLDGVVEGLPRPQSGASALKVFLSPVASGEEVNADEQPDGTLHIDGLYAGAYRIGCLRLGGGRTTGFYLKSILLGAQDVTGQEVKLAHNSPPIRLIYAPNPARVSGTVEHGAGAKVVLVEADREHFIRMESLRVVVCNREGYFTIEGLRPVAYYVFATNTNANMNHEMLREAVFSGGMVPPPQTIHLSEGGEATVDLKMTEWPY